MILRTIFLLSLLLTVLNADVPSCDNGFVEFVVVAGELKYPDSFDNSGPPQYPPNYACEYRLKVQNGYYAKVAISLDAGSTVTPLTVVDHLNRTEEITTADRQTFFFIADGGKIKLTTGTLTPRFGLVLTWYQFPTTIPTKSSISQTDNQPTILSFKNAPNQITTITADTNVAVFAKNLQSTPQNMLRGIVFFDGDSYTSPNLGNGWQLWNSQVQYVSTGNNMTIMNLDSDSGTSSFEVLVQDYALTKSITQFQRNPTSKNDNGFVLDGSTGLSALYSFRDCVLTKVEGSGTLNVYSGTLKQTMVFASYSASSSASYLPQVFQGDVVTFVVTGGKANLTFSYTLDDFKNTKDYGRKGFAKSYAVLSQQMPVVRQINSPDGYIARFGYNISKFDLKGEPTLTIMSLNDGAWSDYETYNSVTPPVLNKLIQFDADGMQILYSPVDSKEDAFFMEFTVNSSPNFSMFWLLVIALLSKFL